MANIAAWYRSGNNLTYRISNLNQNESTAAWQMISQIPSKAGVIASLSFLDQLSQRKSLQSFLNVARNRNVFTSKLFKLSDSTQYALIDFRDPWVLDEINHAPETVNASLKKFYFDTEWNVINAYNEIVLFERGQENGVKLVRHSPQSFIPFDPEKTVMIDDTFALLDVQLDRNQFRQASILPLVFYWKSVNTTNGIYKIRVEIQNDQNMIQHQRRIGSIFDPTNTWREGDYIEDRYWFSISDLKPGQYSLYYSFYETHSDRAVSLKLKNQSIKGDIIKLKFAEITIPAKKG